MTRRMRRKDNTEELAMPSPIEEIIPEITDSDQALSSSALAELSNLSPDELELFRQAWTDIEPQRRREIISRLLELAEDDFELNFDSIFASCLSDPDAEVRSSAIEGLWENEESSLINPLIDILERDDSEIVQAAAATALGKFAMLAEHQKLRSCHESRICQALMATIQGTTTIEVKRHALEAIAPISSPQVTETIREAYYSDDDRLKVSAIYAMGQNCNPSWLPILIKEMASPDAEVRYEAAGASGELGEEEAVPYLIKLINDPDAEMQMASIQALGRIGGPEAKNFLEKCLESPNEVIQQAAEEALHELEIGEEPLPF